MAGQISHRLMHRGVHPIYVGVAADDRSRLVIPLGAEGAERLFDALSPLPGIDFDAGVAALAARAPGRTLVWKKAG